MNKYIIFLFFCFSMYMQASDSSGNDNQYQHAIDIQRSFEDIVDDAAQESALMYMQSAIDKIGGCCVKTSVGCLTLSAWCFFVSMYIAFYTECGQFNRQLTEYEDAFFTAVTDPENRCFFIRPYKKDASGELFCTNAYDRLPQHVVVISNATLAHYGKFLSVEKIYKSNLASVHMYYFPEGCKKYIDYDALCKKARDLQKADLCKAAQVDQKRFFSKKIYLKNKRRS